MSARLKATALLCVAPTIVHLFATVFALRHGDVLLETNLLGMPIIWPLATVLFLVVVGIFAAGFRNLVTALAVWPALVANGSLMILFFGGLFASAGVICLAEVCETEDNFALDSPAIVAPLGVSVSPEQDTSCSHSRLAIGPDATSTCVNLDRSLSAGVYFSAVTFSTVGYGDFQPTPRMRLIAALEAVFGFLFFGLLAGAAIDSFSKTRVPLPGDPEEPQIRSAARDMNQALIALRSRLKGHDP